MTAQISDLLGEDPGEPTEVRPGVHEAMAGCGPGQVAPARHNGRDVAVVVLGDGRAFVVDDRCPHDGGALSDGFVEGDRLVCARHGWEIDPCAGSCPRRGRAPISIRSVPVEGVSGDLDTKRRSA